MWVTCPKCQNRWDWYGDGEYATCSKCRHCWKAEIKFVKSKPRIGLRMIDAIELPEGMVLDSPEGQRWLLLKIQEIRMTVKLTPTDIKILNDLRDDIKTVQGLIHFKDLKESVESLQKQLK